MSCGCAALAQRTPNPACTASHPCGWALEFPLLSACLGATPALLTVPLALPRTSSCHQVGCRAHETMAESWTSWWPGPEATAGERRGS